MRLLLFGNANTLHIYNYISGVLSEIDGLEIVLVNTDYRNVEDDASINNYYKENSIIVLDSNDEHKLFAKYKAINFIYRTIRTYFAITRMEKFEYCQVHYLTAHTCVLPILVKHKYKELICVYWGSDLLKINSLTQKVQKILLKLSSYIVLDALNMKEKFLETYKGTFVQKLRIIRFPAKQLEVMNKIGPLVDIRRLKAELGIDPDKKVVTCGYNGHPDQQQIDVVKSISKCSKDILKQIHILVPLTYAINNSIKEELDIILSKSEIPYTIISEFQTEENLAKLRYASDIYIHARLTDAFSHSLMEYIFANNIIIVGSWLKLKELEENNLYCQLVDGVDEITNKMEYIIPNFNDIKLKTGNNNKEISEMASIRRITELWKQIIT